MMLSLNLTRPFQGMVALARAHGVDPPGLDTTIRGRASSSRQHMTVCLHVLLVALVAPSRARDPSQVQADIRSM